MKCEKCGAEITEGLKFCPDCGEAIKEEPISNPISPVVEEPKKEKPQKQMSEEDKKGPYSTLKFIWTLFLTLIPVVNIIMICKWAFAWGVNINKRNYARAAFILTLLLAVLVVALRVIWPEGISTLANWHIWLIQKLFVAQ